MCWRAGPAACGPTQKDGETKAVHPRQHWCDASPANKSTSFEKDVDCGPDGGPLAALGVPRDDETFDCSKVARLADRGGLCEGYETVDCSKVEDAGTSLQGVSPPVGERGEAMEACSSGPSSAPEGLRSDLASPSCSIEGPVSMTRARSRNRITTKTTVRREPGNRPLSETPAAGSYRGEQPVTTLPSKRTLAAGVKLSIGSVDTRMQEQNDPNNTEANGIRMHDDERDSDADTTVTMRPRQQE